MTDFVLRPKDALPHLCVSYERIAVLLRWWLEYIKPFETWDQSLQWCILYSFPHCLTSQLWISHKSSLGMSHFSLLIYLSYLCPKPQNTVHFTDVQWCLSCYWTLTQTIPVIHSFCLLQLTGLKDKSLSDLILTCDKMEEPVLVLYAFFKFSHIKTQQRNEGNIEYCSFSGE